MVVITLRFQITIIKQVCFSPSGNHRFFFIYNFCTNILWLLPKSVLYSKTTRSTCDVVMAKMIYDQMILDSEMQKSTAPSHDSVDLLKMILSLLALCFFLFVFFKLRLKVRIPVIVTSCGSQNLSYAAAISITRVFLAWSVSHRLYIFLGLLLNLTQVNRNSKSDGMHMEVVNVFNLISQYFMMQWLPQSPFYWFNSLFLKNNILPILAV